MHSDLHMPSVLRSQLWMILLEFCTAGWSQKRRMMGLSGGERIEIFWYNRPTGSRQMARETPFYSKYHPYTWPLPYHRVDVTQHPGCPLTHGIHE